MRFLSGPRMIYAQVYFWLHVEEPRLTLKRNSPLFNKNFVKHIGNIGDIILFKVRHTVLFISAEPRIA